VRREFYQMQKQAEIDRKLDVSWLEMFTKPSYLKRTALAYSWAFFGQSTAVLVIANYGPTLYKTLGFGTEDYLRFQCGFITVGVIFNGIGACLLDLFRRRPLMLFSICGCCIFLIIETAIVASFADAGTNKSGLAMGVATLYLFMAVYSLGVDVAGVAYWSELFPNNARAKGVCAAIATLALTDLVYLQAAPTAFANIGWKFFLVFIIVTGIGAVVVFLYYPETAHVPLEEMAKLFGDTDNIAVYSSDIHLDHKTHELVVGQKHGTSPPAKADTPAGASVFAAEQKKSLEVEICEV